MTARKDEQEGEMVRCGLERRCQYADISVGMEEAVLVVCSNELGLHGATDAISYIFYGNGWSIDDPSYEECREVMKYYNSSRVIVRRCIHCRQLIGK